MEPKKPPVKVSPKGGNTPHSILKHNTTDLTKKGDKTPPRPKAAAKNVTFSQGSVGTTSVHNGPQKTQKAVTMAISTDLQEARPRPSLHQHISLPTICTTSQKSSCEDAVEQQNETATLPMEISGSEERQEVSTSPPSAMSPEAALGDFKSHLTEYEQAEISDYKQVWYLGQKADKTVYSDFSNPEDVRSYNNFGYDTAHGFYRIIMNDHLAYRFEILKVIGTGYSGQVLQCMDHMTKELVAIKVIRTKDSVHQVGKAEVRILEVLQELDKTKTANIAHMREYFYFRKHLCITFQLFEKDLYTVLKDNNRHGLSEKEIRKYAIEILKCLQLLKKQKMVHGDLKPDNILQYKKDGEKKIAVCDFGGCYFMKHRDHPLIHTLFYMSPEMLLDKKCSPATDMWSLGCVLGELHLGKSLFRGHNNKDQFSSIMKVLGIPPPVYLVKAPKRKDFFDSHGVPLEIKEIVRHQTTLTEHLKSKNVNFVDFIQRCLEYEPTQRLTPDKAMQHPWIVKPDTKPGLGAGKARLDAPVACPGKKTALLKGEKVAPEQMPPEKKNKEKKHQEAAK